MQEKLLLGGQLKKSLSQKRAAPQQGSLYLGATILLAFLTAFMGVVLQQALLFSSMVRKKQEYTVQFYAIDSLAEYGVAHALEHYERENYKGAELLFERWPEGGESQAPYSGTIAITKKEDGVLGVQATLLAGSVVVQRVSYELQKESDQQLYQVVNWNR